MQVRPLEARDFEAVRDLLLVLGAHRKAEEADAARPVFDRHVADPAAFSMVAEADGRVVGFAGAQTRERLAHVQPEAWLSELVVHPDARGAGAGAALVRRVVEEARRRGAYRVAVETGHQRREAHRLYERLGFRDTGRFYALPL